MGKRSHSLRFMVPVLAAFGMLAVAPTAHADTATCSEGRCSTAEARLKLEGKDALRTSIDTGWMPSCDNGQEHCNKGLQVRANIALTATVAGANLFTADMPRSAVVEASWENPKFLMLSTASLGAADSTLTVTHSLTPQAELYIDIGPLEQGYVFPATRLLQMIPGSKFEYSATASAPFVGWAFDGASVTVPAPALQSSLLFSVDLAKFPDVIDKVVSGSLAMHARTSPTFTYRTTKVVVAGKALSSAATQLPFPEGNFDYLELPATIEGELSAKGEIEVLPSATLSRIGDLNFNPPTTITFSSVKVTKSYDAPPQKYTFPEKVIRIPLPNVRKPREGLDGGQVTIGDEAPVPALMENTGEAQAVVRLESSDPRFVVPSTPITIAPKTKGALDITFRPDGPGRAEATITARSNDPDSPELTFLVTADGVVGPADGPGGGRNGDGDDSVDGAPGESGCGCKTAGSPQGSAYAGLGLGALGLAALVRRRRR